MEVDSELSNMQSEAVDPLTVNLQQEIYQKTSLKAAFHTARSIFGLRRGTFQETNSVLNAKKGPILGPDRFKHQRDSMFNKTFQKGNLDLAPEVDQTDDSDFYRLNTEALPILPVNFMPQIPEYHKRKESIRLAGQFRIKREVMPLDAFDQLRTASQKISEQRSSHLSSQRDIIRANKRSVMGNAERSSPAMKKPEPPLKQTFCPLKTQ